MACWGNYKFRNWTARGDLFLILLLNRFTWVISQALLNSFAVQSFPGREGSIWTFTGTQGPGRSWWHVHCSKPAWSLPFSFPRCLGMLHRHSAFCSLPVCADRFMTQLPCYVPSPVQIAVYPTAPLVNMPAPEFSTVWKRRQKEALWRFPNHAVCTWATARIVQVCTKQ